MYQLALSQSSGITGRLYPYSLKRTKARGTVERPGVASQTAAHAPGTRLAPTNAAVYTRVVELILLIFLGSMQPYTVLHQHKMQRPGGAARIQQCVYFFLPFAAGATTGAALAAALGASPGFSNM